MSNAFEVELTIVSEYIKTMLDAVSRTQVRAKVISSEMKEVSFAKVKEFLTYLSSVTL